MNKLSSMAKPKSYMLEKETCSKELQKEKNEKEKEIALKKQKEFETDIKSLKDKGS